MWSVVVSFVSGVTAALLANVLWLRRWEMRAPLRWLRKPRFDILAFEPTSVGLFPINRWSTSRPLRRGNLRMQVADGRPRQKWCDPIEWKRLAEQFKNEGKTGGKGYLVDFSIDHHETRSGWTFSYSIAHCSYWEQLATIKYLEEHGEARSKMWDALQRGEIVDLVRSAPPGGMKINVAVISPEGNFLAIQRSGVVDRKRGLWTVGPNETMVLAPTQIPGSQAEDFFGLAERCLREELNLEPTDCGMMNISWLGYDVSTGEPKVFAQVRSHLPHREIEH